MKTPLPLISVAALAFAIAGCKADQCQGINIPTTTIRGSDGGWNQTFTVGEVTLGTQTSGGSENFQICRPTGDESWTFTLAPYKQDFHDNPSALYMILDSSCVLRGLYQDGRCSENPHFEENYLKYVITTKDINMIPYRAGIHFDYGAGSYWVGASTKDCYMLHGNIREHDDTNQYGIEGCKKSFNIDGSNPHSKRSIGGGAAIRTT